MAEHDYEGLAAQYREAKAAITVHRVKQADAERAYAAIYQDLVRRGERPERSAELAEARAAVDKAVADVQWCQAVMVAAAEAFKGEALAAVVERNEANRALIGRRRDEAHANPEGWL